MKRFHVHVHVDDLARSVAFYSKLFAAEPARLEGDYAKWMLDDPRINFAISTRGKTAGVDHLGFQVDDAAELAELKARAESADMALLDEGETTCCYARSEKHWVTDPQGIAWEHFHTLAGIPVFSEAARSAPSSANAASSCCAAVPTTAAQAGSSPATVGHGAPMSAAMSAVMGTAAGAATGGVAAAAPGTGCCGPTVRGKPIGIAVKSADKPAGSCC